MARRGRPVARQDKDGLWNIYLTIGKRPNGRPKQTHVQRKDKDDCEAAADATLAQRKTTGRPPLTRHKHTVESWMTWYFANAAAESCNPGTIYDYESKMRNWVFPLYGAKRLDRFTTEDIDAILRRMRTAGKAQSHRLKLYRILNRALEIARRRGHVTVN